MSIAIVGVGAACGGSPGGAGSSPSTVALVSPEATITTVGVVQDPTPAAPTAAAATSGTGRSSRATIVDYAFQPVALTVPVGTTVTWTNSGARPHTVTADGAAFGSGTLTGGATYAFTFATAGTFAYHCAIHSSMTATVTVTP